MLIEFRVANFRSFKEEQTLSLVASKDAKHPGNLIRCGDFNLLKAAAVYGANASGKSNLLKAIDCAVKFIRASATSMTQGDQIQGIDPFRLDPETRQQPSSFGFKFLLDETIYDYTFAASTRRVHHEKLVVSRPGHKPQQVWFERNYPAPTGRPAWEFGKLLRNDEELLKSKTRDNGLVLSRGAELNVKPLAEVFLWFRQLIRHLDLSQPSFLYGLDDSPIFKDETLKTRVLAAMKDADLGIDGVRLDTRPRSLDDIPAEIREMFSEQWLRENFDENVRVRTLHKIPDSDSYEEFDLHKHESQGTQRFFGIVGFLMTALARGTTLVLDELDCSMHPNLTWKLIELFQSPEVNTTGAQLIFSTHDSALMDQSLLRRDQVWIVEKKQSGASNLFSLWDIRDKPRNTEALQRNYLSGRYGGVPKLGPVFEDLTIE